MKRLKWYSLLLVAMLALPGVGRGQGTGSWERTDLFGNANSLNVLNQFPNFLVQNGSVVLSGAGPGGGYWAKYSLQGQLLWQRRARGALAASVGFTWRSGVFAYGGTYAQNSLGYNAEYYWLNSQGDTLRVRAQPAVQIAHLAQHAATRDGRYYLAGGGNGSGTGQSPLALHYSLVCLDTAGNFRWQRQYLNPVIRLGPQFPAYVGGYAYLRKIVEAPRRGWWLLGDTQRDSANFQLYAIEVDSGGRPRRTRWVEPFGRNAHVQMYYPATALRLRNGSGYVVSGQVRFDSLGRARTHGFVARLDTAMRVVWRTLLEAPVFSPSAPSITNRVTGAVQEAADGSLRVLTYVELPRPVDNEFEILHLSAQGGQLTRRDMYCSQVCALVTPRSWQLLPGDTAIVVGGTGQVRDASGRLLAKPAWVARFDQPCRRQVLTETRAGRASTGVVQLYPQPAAPGAVVRLELARPVRGPVQVQLLDALGRVVALPVTDSATVLALELPAALAPGLYVVRVLERGVSVASARLLVQAP